MDDLMVEKILRAAECIPPGRVATYGSIARLVGTHARLVGRVMAQWGSAVPWWRVVNAGGLLPPRLLPRARELWESEGTSRTDSGIVDVPSAHVSAHALRVAWEKACRELPKTE